MILVIDPSWTTSNMQCVLLSRIHVEQHLTNDDLIRRLCTEYDQSLFAKQQADTTSSAITGDQTDLSRCMRYNISSLSNTNPKLWQQVFNYAAYVDSEVTGGKELAEGKLPSVGDNFNLNVSIQGNKIVIREDPGSDQVHAAIKSRSAHWTTDSSQLRRLLIL